MGKTDVALKKLDNSKGERDYTIRQKIDVLKPLKEILETNILNFKNPNEAQFINNQILIDYITAKKYEGKEINLDDIESNNSFKKNPGLKELFLYYKKIGCKIYSDTSIDAESYYQLQNYYFNENSLKKKIRVHLDIDNKLLNDPKKVKLIVDKIIDKISQITKIPNQDLYVTNVRKGSLIFDLYHLEERIIHRFERQLIVCDIDQDAINQNRNILETFFAQIKEELGAENINQEQHNNREIMIQNVIDNYIVNPEWNLDTRYNKAIGSFGRKSFLFLKWYRDPEEKNNKIYYYPNQRWEGFGLRVHSRNINGHIFHDNNIFNPRSDWCICYCDLSFTKMSYKIDKIKRETFYINNNNTYSRYSLLYQCKIKRSEIISENDGIITLRDNRYIIPYRLLKENLEN